MRWIWLPPCCLVTGPRAMDWTLKLSARISSLLSSWWCQWKKANWHSWIWKEKLCPELVKSWRRDYSLICRAEKKEDAHVEFTVIPQTAWLTAISQVPGGLRIGERIKLCGNRKHIRTDGHVLQQKLWKSTKKDKNHLKQVFSYRKTGSSGRTPRLEATRKCKEAPDHEACKVTNEQTMCQLVGQKRQSREHVCLLNKTKRIILKKRPYLYKFYYRTLLQLSFS